MTLLVAFWRVDPFSGSALTILPVLLTQIDATRERVAIIAAVVERFVFFIFIVL